MRCGSLHKPHSPSCNMPVTLGCKVCALRLQVQHATDVAVQGMSEAAELAQEAYRIPAEVVSEVVSQVVSKPVQHLRNYFDGSSDTAGSSKSDEDGHAMRPLLSSFQEQQASSAELAEQVQRDAVLPRR
jgi:hypothetical protein